MRRLLSLLLVLVLLAGCLSGSNKATGDEQPSHMPAKSLFGDFRLLDAESDKAWFQAYEMTKNPGRAEPDAFSTASGLVPQTAYVALYAFGGDRERPFTAAALHYDSDDQVEKYLSEHAECDNPSVGRTILVDHQDVTILVAGLELSGQDAELMAALHQAEQDVMERTGATIKC